MLLQKLKVIKILKAVRFPKCYLIIDKNLLYITRAPAPTNKNFQFIKAYKQVCIYAYPRKLILSLRKNKKSHLENIEDIEILRFLESEIKIK